MPDHQPALFEHAIDRGPVRTAEISPCGRYRWWLKRRWECDGNGRTVCFVMLNPSTADATTDDPTVRRCMGFARRWGFTELVIRNLFPLRATDPNVLLTADCPTGGIRGEQEFREAAYANVTVAAWGAKVPFARDRHVIADLTPRTPLYCLGTTKEGHPRHPLYVRADQPLQLYSHPRILAEKA